MLEYDYINILKGSLSESDMIEMVVCGLLAWYHVDCIEFQYFDLNPSSMRDPNGVYFDAMSQKFSKSIGVMDIFKAGEHDACGNSVMGHEYQRYHQQRWDMDFCQKLKV